jgi:hypothetical protein
MSAKLIQVLEKLEEAKRIIKEQQKEIEHLKHLITILGEHK